MHTRIVILALAVLMAGCATEPAEPPVPQPEAEQWAVAWMPAFRALEERMVQASYNATAAVEAYHYSRAADAYEDAVFRAEAGASWAASNSTPEYGDRLRQSVADYFWTARYHYESAENCYAAQAAGSPPPPVCDGLQQRKADQETAYEAMLDEYVRLVPRRST